MSCTCIVIVPSNKYNKFEGRLLISTTLCGKVTKWRRKGGSIKQTGFERIDEEPIAVEFLAPLSSPFTFESNRSALLLSNICKECKLLYFLEA